MSRPARMGPHDAGILVRPRLYYRTEVTPMLKPALLMAVLTLAACAHQPSHYADILDAYKSGNAAIVEEYRAGKLTKAEALAADDKLYNELMAQADMRAAARRVSQAH